jgi:hypothetical protein
MPKMQTPNSISAFHVRLRAPLWLDERKSRSRTGTGENGSARIALTFDPNSGVIAMGTTPISDQSITRQVENRLSGRGLSSPCHVAVETKNGEVTLSGSVQYAHQKGPAVQVANVISGVRRVIDRLIVKTAAKY